MDLVELPRFPLEGAEGVSGGLVAPMPGNVLAMYVAVGDSVEKGHLMLILEAMKMETEINSPITVKVNSILVQEGTNVQTGDKLILIE